ncbi:hypothetical protein RDWZM_005241 [Blomia tropicalis]|uniref:Uncharacterized protein n=1 Tax=Blomia tropicalis TaxID=40697 RepID=A0A9Q0RM55_BLOTA|nr:hypothetical protein RDWZM_005241 [Blomia tropicalis]
MFRYLIFITLFASSLAYNGYGRKTYNQANRGSNYRSPTYQAPIYQQSEDQGFDDEQTVQESKSYNLPVQSSRTLEYIDVPNTYQKSTPLNVAIPPAEAPITFVLRSRSSPLNIQSYHEASKGSYAESSSEDAAHVRVHTVTRPVVQEVREIITPYRKVQQQVQPVQEMSETYVARKQEYEPKYEENEPAPVPIPASPTKQIAAKPVVPVPKQTYAKPAAAPIAPKQTYAKPAAPKQAPKPVAAPKQRPAPVAAASKQAYAKSAPKQAPKPAYQAKPTAAPSKKISPPAYAKPKATAPVYPKKPVHNVREQQQYQQQKQEDY